MSRGKYSPVCPKGKEFIFNCYGRPPFNDTMAADYDDEGFDRYGYSEFDADGAHVGIDSGVDRMGYTENEYLEMDLDQFDDVCARARKYFG